MDQELGEELQKKVEQANRIIDFVENYPRLRDEDEEKVDKDYEERKKKANELGLETTYTETDLYDIIENFFYISPVSDRDDEDGEKIYEPPEITAVRKKASELFIQEQLKNMEAGIKGGHLLWITDGMDDIHELAHETSGRSYITGLDIEIPDSKIKDYIKQGFEAGIAKLPKDIKQTLKLLESDDEDNINDFMFIKWDVPVLIGLAKYSGNTESEELKTTMEQVYDFGIHIAKHYIEKDNCGGAVFATKMARQAAEVFERPLDDITKLNIEIYRKHIDTLNPDDSDDSAMWKWDRLSTIEMESGFMEATITDKEVPKEVLELRQKVYDFGMELINSTQGSEQYKHVKDLAHYARITKLDGAEELKELKTSLYKELKPSES
jgi:hypothetical protein